LADTTLIVSREESIGDGATGAGLAPEERRKQKFEAVGQLAAGVAHNFNNTLQGILGNVELARMQAPDDIKPFLDNALSACAEARRLVRDLLLFSGTQVRPNREDSRAEACVERVVSMCRITFERSIALTVEKNGVVPPLSIQAFEFEHAVFNLLLRARDASVGQAAPKVSVELMVTEAAGKDLADSESQQIQSVLCLTVRDNGPGLPMDAQSKNESMDMVSSCALDHGGWLEVKTVLHEGTAISMFLPYPPVPSRAQSVPQSTVKPAGPVVLVVDDDDIVRDSVARVLRFGGFTAFAVSDGAKALEFVAKASPMPALVLMDESMPGMDGTSVRKKINKMAPEVRIIMISGHGSDELDGQGVDGVLEKPVRAESLLETVRKTLGVVRTPS
jgi:two-component system, cell cycle sensor histidine kinase and response regulator CckA